MGRSWSTRRCARRGQRARGGRRRVRAERERRRHLRVEHWGDALGHGEVAGRTLAGEDARWESVPGFWSTIGERTLKYAAWGDGYDEARLEGHAGGAFTVWYAARRRHGRRAHARTRRGLRARSRADRRRRAGAVMRAGRARRAHALPGPDGRLRAVVVVPARDEAGADRSVPSWRWRRQRDVAARGATR